jgi:Rha family phage regulatory protein
MSRLAFSTPSFAKIIQLKTSKINQQITKIAHYTKSIKLLVKFTKKEDYMKELQIFEHKNQLVVDSRDVAEMVGKNHKDLLESIRNYIQYLESGKFRSQDFFISHTYKVDGNNKTYDCYLLTRKGCDMVANKMTGEKGVLFTAAYVDRFYEMERKLNTHQIPQTLSEALRLAADLAEKNAILAAENETQKQIIGELQPKADYVDYILSSTGTVTTTQIAADYCMTANQMNKLLLEARIQHKVNGQWVLYKEHMGLGYTKSETISITHKDGTAGTKMFTKWTQKGRLKINEALNSRGIYANMDLISK